MATYRLYPSTSGPSAPASYNGDFISGVVFGVAGGGNWLEGYWWWVCPDEGGSGFQPTGATKCALWSVTSSGGGVLVPGSVVTSGALTAGQWNYIPLSTPIQLAPSVDPTTPANGSAYVAAIGCNGPFPDTADGWTDALTNGTLTGYANGATPYGIAQGCFSDTGTDPSVTFPGQSSSEDTFWVDVQISTAPPPGYTGSYRLWPNKADANNETSGDAELNYTIATEIDLTQACTLNNAWYYSASGFTELATRCDVWNIETGLPVASITSPSWSAAAGSGWISAAFAADTVLPAGNYRVSVYCANGTSGVWAAKDNSSNYYGQGGSGGVGAAGITWPCMTAPSQPDAASGYTYNASDSGSTPPYTNGVAISAQPPFGQTPGGTVIFPQLYAPVGAETNQTQNYWVDLEVTPVPASPMILGDEDTPWHVRIRS